MTNSPYNRLVKCGEAAAYLGICERKLWELSKDGRIPSVRIDRSVRFDIADLDAFIEKAKGGV
ncbi:MAG: helix-turn-helix domain-containing protein [Planctomycetes bacterium]|nr:helix-turn-helix domain-containing protein [Planctomycetota bacterium]MBL7145824.1 helix-turn-helix domain-containing protein [Phycisphaerae bacterium]